MRVNKKLICLFLYFIGTVGASYNTNVFGSGGDEYCGDKSMPRVPDVKWFQGGWGIRFVLPAGNDPEVIDRFMGPGLIDQLAEIKTARWVMLNLTGPTWGGIFTSPSSRVEKILGKNAVPHADLLYFYINSLRAIGYKIILYVASQGPSLQFLRQKREEKLSQLLPKLSRRLIDIDRKWGEYIEGSGLDESKEFANIIRDYSLKFGTKVDAWWFDHGVHAKANILVPAAKAGNKDVLIAWNARKRIIIDHAKHQIWPLERTTPYSEYTDGHISLTLKNGRGKPPWWSGNLYLLEQIESCSRISGALPHLFLPLQETWRAGSMRFPDDMAIEWTQSVINSNAAVTWAVALRQPEFNYAEIDPSVFSILRKIDENLMGVASRDF